MKFFFAIACFLVMTIVSRVHGEAETAAAAAIVAAPTAATATTNNLRAAPGVTTNHPSTEGSSMVSISIPPGIFSNNVAQDPIRCYDLFKFMNHLDPLQYSLMYAFTEYSNIVPAGYTPQVKTRAIADGVPSSVYNDPMLPALHYVVAENIRTCLNNYYFQSGPNSVVCPLAIGGYCTRS